MRNFPIYIIILFLMIALSEFSLSGQEVLRPSRIQARAVRKNLPKLGLPERISGEIDPLEYELPDPEMDYEWEMDMHEIL